MADLHFIFASLIGLVLLSHGSYAMRIEEPNATYTFSMENCDIGQTDCGTGCCPYSNAVCCLDGYECCQEGKICIPYAGLCIGLSEENENGKPKLVSGKPASVINFDSPCPHGTTTCSKEKCCAYPSATCCSDGEHCCPHGYSCDIAHKRCVKKSSEMWSNLHGVNEIMAGGKSSKLFNRKLWKSCPGGTQKCSTNYNCCLNDDGTYDCCPKPSTYSGGKVTDQNCCQSYFGYICCNFPSVCTSMGCM